MNIVQFCSGMKELECDARDITPVVRMIVKLSQTYPWVGMDQFLTIGLEMVPRAKDTYKSTKASFRTHLVTVVRNACISYLSRESRNRERMTLGDARLITVPSTECLLTEVSFQDEVEVLEKILSPYACQFLHLVLDAIPQRLSNRSAGEKLSLGGTSVSHLRHEVEFAVQSILGVTRMGRGRKKGGNL